MARTARFKSEYMHIINRGIGKQILFEDDFDRNKYIEIIGKCVEETDVSVVAYCLMENHVHLLLYSKERDFSKFMQKLGTRYAQYYNKKYEHVGYLFQGRYKSEAILGNDYLLTVFRYILNNPVKAGICSAAKYEWSSFKEYGCDNGFTDSTIFVNIIGGKKEFKKFLMVEDETECMENISWKHDDNWAKEIISKVIGTSTGTVIQKFDKKKRNETLVKLKEMGISVRQLERLTGINRGIIQRAKCVSKTRPH